MTRKGKKAKCLTQEHLGKLHLCRINPETVKLVDN